MRFATKCKEMNTGAKPKTSNMTSYDDIETDRHFPEKKNIGAVVHCSVKILTKHSMEIGKR